MLLSGHELSGLIAQKCGSLTNELTVFSAFVKTAALEWLSDLVPPNVNVTIVARWQARDLCFGASDLAVYELCRQLGWRFGIDLLLHSKVFVFDSEHVLLGSSNLTRSGLALGKSGNVELGTMITPSLRDIDTLKSLEEGVRWVDDDLYKAFLNEQKLLEVEKSDDPRWSDDLINRLSRPVGSLWISELPQCSPDELLWPDFSNPRVANSLDLLGLDSDTINRHNLQQNFLSSRVFAWLMDKMKTASPGQYTNFGWVTEQLHNSVLDEPPPERTDIKEYVKDLFAFVLFAASDNIEIISHRHTKSLKLI